MCRSVYLPRSARQADQVGPGFGELHQSLAERRRLGALSRRGERGDHRRCGQARGAALAALPLLLQPNRADVFRAHHAVLPASSTGERLLPFIRLDAQEVIALPLLEEGHALGHLGVADDDARHRLAQRPRRVESADQRTDIVAVDALRMPAEGGEPVGQMLQLR